MGRIPVLGIIVKEFCIESDLPGVSLVVSTQCSKGFCIESDLPCVSLVVGTQCSEG